MRVGAWMCVCLSEQVKELRQAVVQMAAGGEQLAAGFCSKQDDHTAGALEGLREGVEQVRVKMACLEMVQENLQQDMPKKASVEQLLEVRLEAQRKVSALQELLGAAAQHAPNVAAGSAHNQRKLAAGRDIDRKSG